MVDSNKEDGGDLAGPRTKAKRRVQGGRGPYNTTSKKLKSAQSCSISTKAGM